MPMNEINSASPANEGAKSAQNGIGNEEVKRDCSEEELGLGTVKASSAEKDPATKRGSGQ